MNTFRPTGGKDRHLKVNTSKGTRDRRIRLSVSTAIQLYDIQDRLGYNQPSMAVEWLIKNAQQAISELAQLPSIALRGVTSESHIPGTTAPSRVPSNDDQYPRCKPSVDTYSLAGSLLPKENYDSGFTESTSRTFHHASSARPDSDNQTRTRDEDCAPVRLVEQRFPKDLPSCSTSEACHEERDVGYSIFKIDSRIKARERARERAKVKSSLKMSGQKDIMSTRFTPSTRVLQLHPADNQLSCSLTYPTLQSSQSAQHPSEKVPIPSLQNIAQSPNELRLMSSPLIDPLRFSHRIPPPPQPQNVNEMLLRGSLDQTRLQLGSMRSDISLGCLQPGASSTSTTNVHGITSPFSVSYFPPHAVYPYLSTSGHPIFQAITVNQLTSLGLPIPNCNQQEVFCHSEAYRPLEFSSYSSLTSASTVYTSAPTNISQEKGQERINLWQGWPRTFGHGFNMDSSSACNARTLFSQQRPVNIPDPTVHLFSGMNRTLSPHPTTSLNRPEHERERIQMSSGRGTFRSLIEGTGTLDDVFDSESHSP